MGKIMTNDLKHGFVLIPTRISKHVLGKVRDKIIYSFPKFKGHTFEVWECISNFNPDFIMDVITYPYRYSS